MSEDNNRGVRSVKSRSEVVEPPGATADSASMNDPIQARAAEEQSIRGDMSPSGYGRRLSRSDKFEDGWWLSGYVRLHTILPQSPTSFTRIHPGEIACHIPAHAPDDFLGITVGATACLVRRAALESRTLWDSSRFQEYSSKKHDRPCERSSELAYC